MELGIGTRVSIVKGNPKEGVGTIVEVTDYQYLVQYDEWEGKGLHDGNGVKQFRSPRKDCWWHTPESVEIVKGEEVREILPRIFN